MPTISINYFGGGIASDYQNAQAGESAISKQFDILSYPYRLHPLRGMTDTSEPTDTLIGNIILGENGTFYGIGTDPSNPTLGELYKRGTGGSDFWEDFGTEQKSGVGVEYDFLVHFPEMGATRKLFWAGANTLVVSDPADGGSSIDSDSLSHSSIGQGIVHPKDKTLYFPYKTTTAGYIGKIASHGSDAFGATSYTAFEFPNRYRAYCLSWYGDYLAIPLTIAGLNSTQQQSVVALWDRDTSLTTANETIPWGSGVLKVLNNVGGALIGVSEEGSVNAQDRSTIQIKAYGGGAEPVLIKEIKAERITSTSPSTTINPRVNFVKNNRLYFSANIIHGGSAPSYYGVWSVGRNIFGQWTVTLERMGTNTGTTGVIAGAMSGDFFTCVENTEGSLSYTINPNSDPYQATSVYEFPINANMPAEHERREKTLKSIYYKTLPMPANGQVVLKYRVDSLQDDAWTTVGTETTDDNVYREYVIDSNGAQFQSGYNYEFRLESTGGAIITEFGYNYDILKSNNAS